MEALHSGRLSQTLDAADGALQSLAERSHAVLTGLRLTVRPLFLLPELHSASALQGKRLLDGTVEFIFVKVGIARTIECLVVVWLQPYGLVVVPERKVVHTLAVVGMALTE